MKKIIIAGTRYFDDYELMKATLDPYLKGRTDVEIVSGGANGADKLGEQYANEHGFPVKRFPADWEKYGRKAGPIRNGEMADYADGCFIFWDGKSRGTKSMITLAKDKHVALKVVIYPLKNHNERGY